ncbi:tripartite-type tricarboxylate transporter receptor subunit TctC [Paraburkholderia silvatlantica]|uniref:Tripartite-type tricarboxylate transporter receptor subunit TctC n=1 Tax=Paraburkholderia silvatlantica TaxID=321895 RepID=A0A2V4TNT5_9BURK|nr:tripartite tricarboxylate transporter substrate binding protein [Paraburkholderia silvatlantica]PYE25471.1 tripartite-type tricarboxylate transporter receptor subunit TctC [Paraburkholderia silvatlantica]
MNRRQLLVASLGLSTTTFAFAQDASEYPSRTVRLMVGFAAGGPQDNITRMLAEYFGKQFDRSFYVENRPGANGEVAANYTKYLTADGYSLLLAGSGAMSVAPSMQTALGYNSAKDFTAIGRVSGFVYLLAVPSSSPFKSTRDLILYGRTNKGALSYASAGIGATNHLAGEWFKSRTGVDAVHVPYKGDAEALTDLIAGRVSYAFIGGPGVIAQAKAGKLRILASSGLTQKQEGIDVPTVAQAANIPDFDVVPWTGLFAPAGLASGIVGRLNTAIMKSMATPEAKARLLAIGQFSFTDTPEQFAQYLRTENARWASVVELAQIRKM